MIKNKRLSDNKNHQRNHLFLRGIKIHLERVILICFIFEFSNAQFSLLVRIRCYAIDVPGRYDLDSREITYASPIF